MSPSRPEVREVNEVQEVKEKTSASFARREVDRLHNKLVIAAVQYQVGDLRDFGFDDGVVIAQRRGALEHRSRFEFPRAGIKLDADIRGDHRPKDGNILRTVHANKNEDKRIGLAA